MIHDDNPLLTSAGVRISPNGKIIVAPITIEIAEVATRYKSETHMWSRNDGGKWVRQKRAGKGLAVNAVNDHGTFVGQDVNAVNGVRYPNAFICSMENGLQAIGVLKGDVESDALDINNHGVVVGWSTDSLRPIRCSTRYRF